MIFEDACGIERSQMLQFMSVKKVEAVEFGSLIENFDEKVEAVRQRPVKIKDKKSSSHSLYLNVRSTCFKTAIYPPGLNLVKRHNMRLAECFANFAKPLFLDVRVCPNF